MLAILFRSECAKVRDEKFMRTANQAKENMFVTSDKWIVFLNPAIRKFSIQLKCHKGI